MNKQDAFDYIIEVSETNCSVLAKYIAIFDTYDGTPIDNETPSPDPIGQGNTPFEAMYDLLEKALDKGQTK